MTAAPAPDSIRNFAVIAHIDHGKSTLADRLIERAHAVPRRSMRAQLLDSMELERERGITIKAQTVRLEVSHQGKNYILNLIDTPGHSDFSYEVSRSLAACEGALLLVDAAQGVEAQTLANGWAASDAGLEILPVLNKIDLAAAEPERVSSEIEDIAGLDASSALNVSAKTGQGVDGLIKAIIDLLPPPQGSAAKPLQALIIDSWFDAYLGVISLIRIKQGVLRRGDTIRLLQAGAEYTAGHIGVFRPQREEKPMLSAGEIGYIAAGMKDIAHARIGDTLTLARQPAPALPGFAPSHPAVFCALFPAESGQWADLRDALAKLRLNDAGIEYEPAHSPALGPGFRCGFLGLLHLEISLERLRREFSLNLISTVPGVVYELLLRDGSKQALHHAGALPDQTQIAEIREPFVEAAIVAPENYLGRIITLCQERRGVQKSIANSAHNNSHNNPQGGGRAVLTYDLPLAEIIFDFHDRLKSASKGYASFDYRPADMRPAPIRKLSILVNGEEMDALALLVHAERAEKTGRAMVKSLKESIPRHLFKIPLQAAAGGRIIARETIPALRKDVTAKCYGGDISRKRKLLDKQKAGKKKMRQLGRVNVPQEAFLSLLRGGVD